MGKILVAGASGNIGRELTRRLAAVGADYDVLRSRGGATGGDPAVRVASYADPAALATAFAGIETLFVVLPLIPDKLALARNVATAARAAGVRHVVRASGAGADPAAPYALPRLQGQIDAVFEATGLATTFLRPAAFMQNYATYMAGMVRSGQVYAASADAPQSLVDVRDVAAVATVVLQDPAAHAGRAYTLTGPKALTDTQRVAILARALDRPIAFTPISLVAAEERMRAMGMPPAVVEWLGSLNQLTSAGLAAATSPDIVNLLERPATSFERFVVDHLSVWKDQ